MRKITQQAVAAFMKGQPFSKANTEVYTVAGVRKTVFANLETLSVTVTVLRLHGNDIARRWTQGHTLIEVTTAGWNTVTTRERLNGIPGVSVHQSKHVLHLNDEPWDGEWMTVHDV